MAVALICSFEGRPSSVEYVGRVLENAATGRRGRLEVGTMRRLNMSEEVTEGALIPNYSVLAVLQGRRLCCAL
jgi:hypothetical protein